MKAASYAGRAQRERYCVNSACIPRRLRSGHHPIDDTGATIAWTGGAQCPLGESPKPGDRSWE